MITDPSPSMRSWMSRCTIERSPGDWSKSLPQI